MSVSLQQKYVGYDDRRLIGEYYTFDNRDTMTEWKDKLPVNSLAENKANQFGGASRFYLLIEGKQIGVKEPFKRWCTITQEQFDDLLYINASEAE